MPVYEYRCRDCQRTFIVVMSVKDHESEQVRCPQCQGTAVEQMITPFHTKTSKKTRVAN